MANGNSFVADLARHIGQTVTIFTTSGGESGSGFTGVLVSVNPCFVRLITQIGSAPGCALGNCCDDRRCHDRRCHDRRDNGECNGEENNVENLTIENELLNINEQRRGNQRERLGGQRERLGGQGRANCDGFTLGSVVDIPVDRIASFVHNAVGSGW